MSIVRVTRLLKPLPVSVLQSFNGLDVSFVCYVTLRLAAEVMEFVSIPRVVGVR